MKKVYSFLLSLILFSTSTIGQVNLKNGLVGCYPFNTNAKDESGNNNNGIVNGAILTVDRFGNPNSAYLFDGNSSIDLPDNKFSFDNYSYAMWVYVTNIPNSGDSYRMIAIGGACGDQTLALSYNYFNAVGFDFGVYNKPALANTPLAIGTLPQIGKWYHLTAVRDDLTLNLYINGVLAKSVSSNNTKPYYGCDAVEKARFGIRNGGVQGFKGALDDIHLYNRPLNASEVKALYDGNTPPTITITSNSNSPCAGDKIIFTANGGSATSKYLWKIDGVNQTPSSKTFEYVFTKKTGDYQIKVSVEVTDGEPCFPQKPSISEQIFTIKDCTISTSINLKSGLIACYPFNANAKDESGNGNDGSINGATLTTDRFGNANSAYNFDGVNQFIEVSANKFKNNNYSFSIWANPDEIPFLNNYSYPFSIGGSGGDQSLDLSNSANNATGWTFGGYLIGDSRVPFCHQGYLPTVPAWFHIVGVRDNNTMYLYVNGQLVMSENTGGYVPYYGNNTKVTIGCRSSLVQFFKGKVDDIHLYNRPLNAAEVKALYDGDTPQTISITSNSASPCGGDKITFTANGGSATSTYLWKIDDVNQSSKLKTLDYTSNKKTGDYQVKVSVEVTDSEPCFPQKPSKNEETFTVKDCVESDKTLIPNAFSPNGDGVNDTWEIHGIKNNPDVVVEIYDRWGELIFYSKGYSTPWDGTYKNTPLNEGTYAYVVKSSNDLIFKGAILLVR